MPRRVLQGLKEIAEHVGLQPNHNDSRRVVRSWIEREKLPAVRLSGRWYVDADELEKWWIKRLTVRAS